MLGSWRYPVAALILSALTLGSAGKCAGGSLHGRIRDAETGMPVDHVSMIVVELTLHTESDGQGIFGFDDLPDGRYTLRWVRIGYVNGSREVEVGAGEPGQLLELLLVPIPVTSAGVTINADKEHRFLDDRNNPSLKLGGRKLQESMGQTLALTLRSEAGMSVRSMGPAPARPVVRGLSGDRVQISEDGEKTSDLSATAPDHAVTVDPFMAENILVTRGPRVLLRTPVTIGGLIDVVRNEIPERRFESVSGIAGVSREVVGRATQAGVAVNLPAGPIVARGELSRRYASDITTPLGSVGNTYSSMTTYSAAAGWVGSHERAGVSFREFRLGYGIPGGFVGAHPRGVTIDIFRRQVTAKGAWFPASSFFESIELHATRNYYHHTEYEANGLVGSEFSMFTHSARAEVHHGPSGPLHGGAWGVSFESRLFEPGGFVFTPKTNTISLAAAAYEQAKVWSMDLECAARLSLDEVVPDLERPLARIGPIRKRSFATYSLSASLSGTITDDLSAGVVLSRSSRVPTIEELFSEGPHLAAYSFEVGNPGLGEESGVGLEGNLTYATERLHMRFSPFVFSMPSYVITLPTGATNYSTLLPIYASAGVSARLIGFDAEAIWHAADPLQLSLTVSYTRGDNLTGQTALPVIPPLRAKFDVRYAISSLTIGASCEVAAGQDRVAPFESPTAGYGTLSVFTQWILPTTDFTHTFNFSASNLLDQEYRNHLSRARSILPESGRNFRIMYKIYF